MHGPKKILVGTDLSESSKAALETAAFYAKTFDADVILASVFDPFSGLGLDKGLAGGGGGEGGGGQATPRRDFRASAYFNPSVLTGDDGRAEVRFKLPDTLTTWRVMAVAVAEDRYGSSAERVTTLPAAPTMHMPSTSSRSAQRKSSPR